MSKYSENMPEDLKSAIGWMYDYIKPDTTLLDFGCSTGYFGSLIKKAKQVKVYGVEVSKDIDEARKVLDGVYGFDLDGQWPKEIYERTYDYLFFGDVLEHLKTPGEVLKKAAKLLKKGGKVFISIPNIAHISTRLELLLGNFEYEPMGILDNTHLKYFTLSSFTQLANDAGYQIEIINYTVDDYPRELIAKILTNVGLIPNDIFWKMTETAESRTSQYKFVIALSTSKINQSKLLTQPLPDKPEHQRDSFIEDLRTQANVLHKHADEQAKVIKHYVDLSKKLAQENQLLKEKFTHRLKHSIKSRINRDKGE